MKNIKKDLLDSFYFDLALPIAADIVLEGSGDTRDRRFTLKVGHSADEYLSFIHSLDVNHPETDEMGDTPLHGTIWFEDGSWLEHMDLGYCKGWHKFKTPKIPDYLKKV